MSQPYSSCFISVAEGGDVGIFIDSRDFVPGRPCLVRVSVDGVYVMQDGAMIVRLHELDDGVKERVLSAPEIIVVRVLGAGTANEVMSICMDVSCERI